MGLSPLHVLRCRTLLSCVLLVCTARAAAASGTISVTVFPPDGQVIVGGDVLLSCAYTVTQQPAGRLILPAGASHTPPTTPTPQPSADCTLSIDKRCIDNIYCPLTSSFRAEYFADGAERLLLVRRRGATSEDAGEFRCALYCPGAGKDGEEEGVERESASIEITVHGLPTTTGARTVKTSSARPPVTSPLWDPVSTTAAPPAPGQPSILIGMAIAVPALLVLLVSYLVASARRKCRGFSTQRAGAEEGFAPPPAYSEVLRNPHKYPVSTLPRHSPTQDQPQGPAQGQTLGPTQDQSQGPTQVLTQAPTQAPPYYTEYNPTPTQAPPYYTEYEPTPIHAPTNVHTTAHNVQQVRSSSQNRNSSSSQNRNSSPSQNSRDNAEPTSKGSN